MKLHRTTLMTLLLILSFGLTGSARTALAQDKIRIAATTSNIASLTHSITGDLAEIYTIASPSQNLHFISPTPKDVLKTRKADVFIHGGLDLEIWRNPLLDAAGRRDFISGERAIDVSQNVPLLEIPHDLSRIHGDVHAHGNPHYFTDPENAKTMAKNIAEGLSALYPEKKELFEKNTGALTAQLNEKIKEWTNRLNVYRGAKIVTYHSSWIYFLTRFGLVHFDSLEPKPGIPPTPRHMKNLIERMKTNQVRLIIRESYNERGTPNKAAKAAGAKIAVLSPEAGEIKSDYAGMVEHNVRQLEEALKGDRGK